MEGAFDVAERPSDERGTSVQRRAWAGPLAALVAGAVLAGSAVWVLRGPASEEAQSVLRMAIATPDVRVGISESCRILAISAEGTTLVYAGSEARQLYARRLDQAGSVPLEGTEGARDPFISPDGAWVGFTTQGAQSIRKASLVGEGTVTVVEASNTIRGGTWTNDASIAFCVDGMGLLWVREGGAEPERVEVQDLLGCYAPSFIADANAVLLVTDTDRVLTTGEAPLGVVDLNTGELKSLGVVGTWPRYVSSGHLVYATGSGELRAVPFGTDSLEIVGTPVQVMDGVSVTSVGSANFDVSEDGLLIYLSGSGGRGDEQDLVWVDRQGGEEPLNAPPHSYLYPRLSPDGTQVAVPVVDAQGGHLWLWHLERETLSPVATEAIGVRGVLWTPDGHRLIFNTSSQTGNSVSANNLFWAAADNSGGIEPLTDSRAAQFPSSISPDGEMVVFGQQAENGSGRDLYAVSLTTDYPVKMLQGTAHNESKGAISPDGRWLAYDFSISGQSEIYVRSFPDDSGPGRVVSSGGGSSPLWSRDGRELFYESENKLMVLSVQTEPTFDIGRPQVLIDGPYFFGGSIRPYDISLDDQRFLMMKPTVSEGDEADSSQFHAIVNWFEELKRLVPTN